MTSQPARASVRSFRNPSLDPGPWTLDRFRIGRFVPRILALAFIAAYLAVTGRFFGRQLLGDPYSAPASYLFTWDMFPWYDTWSTRSLLVGETDSRKYVNLYPNDRHRFRWGRGGDRARLDLQQRNLLVTQRIFDDAITRYAETNPHGRLVRVYFVEQYWPVKHNLPADLYELQTGETQPQPPPRYWRVRAEGSVVNGRVQWAQKQ